MSQSSVPFTAGPPETVLDPPPAAASDALAAALAEPVASRRAAVSKVAAANPRYLDAWARLADLAEEGGEPVEAYAYAHRGFLSALDALRRAAAAIGEAEEAQRCELFLAQLDPDLRPGVGPLPGR